MPPPADREHFRFGPVNWGKDVAVTVDADRLEAEVRDESLGGLGLHLIHRAVIDHGREIRVDNGTFARTGKIIFIADDPDGGMRLGIEWLPNKFYEDV